MLGEFIGSGGEAAVYATTFGGQELVAKIFSSQVPGDLDSVVSHANRRLTTRVMNSLTVGTEKVLYPVVAAPFAILRHPTSDEVVGTLARRVPTGFGSLDNWLRGKHGPPASVHAARHLAAAVTRIHEADYVIGDISPSNFLVHGGSGAISAIDVDSFGFTLSNGGFRPPTSTTKHYQPRSRILSVDSDRFSLACLILQLLIGLSPYAGTPLDGSSNSIQGNIDAGLSWLFEAGKLRLPKPMRGHPGIRALPPELQSLAQEGLRSGSPPSAERWEKSVAAVTSQLTTCDCSAIKFRSAVCPGEAHWRSASMGVPARADAGLNSVQVSTGDGSAAEEPGTGNSSRSPSKAGDWSMVSLAVIAAGTGTSSRSPSTPVEQDVDRPDLASDQATDPALAVLRSVFVVIGFALGGAALGYLLFFYGVLAGLFAVGVGGGVGALVGLVIVSAASPAANGARVLGSGDPSGG